MPVRVDPATACAREAVALLASAPWPTSCPCEPCTTTSRVVGSLADVVAPPYDVIDASQRAELAARSPFNVVAVDLPQGEPAATPTRPRLSYLRRGSYRVRWCATVSRRSGRTLRTTPAPTACGAHGAASSAACASRSTARACAPARAHTSRATRRSPASHAGDTREHLPDFSLYSDPTKAAWRSLGAATRSRRGARSRTPKAPSTASGASPTRRDRRGAGRHERGRAADRRWPPPL